MALKDLKLGQSPFSAAAVSPPLPSQVVNAAEAVVTFLTATVTDFEAAVNTAVTNVGPGPITTTITVCGFTPAFTAVR